MLNKTPAIKIKDAYQTYLIHQRDHLHVSDATLANTTDCVGRFVKSCGNLGLSAITESHIDAHFTVLRDESALAHATLAKHKAAIRAFFNYCLSQKWINSNPADVLLRREHAYSFSPVHSRPAPRESVNTVAACLADYAARRDFRFCDVRDALLISITIDSGNRRGEIRKIRRKDLERALESGRLLSSGRTVYRLSAMGKTGTATIQFYDETAVLARKLLSIQPSHVAYIFVNSRNWKLLAEDSLRFSFYRICKFAGVPRFGFQATRKRVVRDAIVLSGDDKAGQLIAGHKDIRTTQIHYNDMSQDEADEVGAMVADLRRGKPPKDDDLAGDFFRKVQK